MSWHVAPSQFCPASSPWAVARDVDGSIVGCYVTRVEAEATRDELYARTFDQEQSDERAINGTCQTGCDHSEEVEEDEEDPDDDNIGERPSGAFGDVTSTPDGTPGVPAPYTIPMTTPPIMNQVPWQETGPAKIPCPYTTPTTQCW